MTPNIPYNHVKIPGYDLYGKDRPHRIGGGVAIYAKHKLNMQIVEIQASCVPVEQIWLQMHLKKRNTYIGSMYIPYELPLYQFEVLEDLFIELVPQSDDLICKGDLNINLLIDSAVTQQFMKTIRMFNLEQKICEPTCINGRR